MLLPSSEWMCSADWMVMDQQTHQNAHDNSKQANSLTKAATAEQASTHCLLCKTELIPSTALSIFKHQWLDFCHYTCLNLGQPEDLLLWLILEVMEK